MKTLFNILKTTLLGVCVTCSGTVFAQEDVSDIIKSSPADATKLANAYLTPLFKGFGIGLNSGWNNTAASKGTGRFELRISASGAFVPTSDKTFDVTKLGLSSKVTVASGGNISQTVGGEDKSGPVLNIKDSNGNTLESFTLPPGAGMPFVPAPQVQLTVGLPKNIDITLRTMPKIKLGDDAGEIGMTGAGIKLNLVRMLSKTADKLLPIDLAVAFGFTKFNYTLPLDVDPPSGTVPKTASDLKDFNTQRLSAKFSGTNMEAIVSKKLLLFTPFLSVGYSTSKTDLGLLGNYPILTDYVVGPPVIKQYTSFTDPITIKQKDISGLHTTVGFKINLLLLRIYGSYSMAEYNSVNAGIGLGIGK